MKFSKAIMKIAKRNLKNYKKQADEAFLVRAKIIRILDEL
jgi:hypothetical protein